MVQNEVVYIERKRESERVMLNDDYSFFAALMSFFFENISEKGFDK